MHSSAMLLKKKTKQNEDNLLLQRVHWKMNRKTTQAKYYRFTPNLNAR